MTPTPYHQTAAFLDACFARVRGWRPAQLRKYLGVPADDPWTDFSLQCMAVAKLLNLPRQRPELSAITSREATRRLRLATLSLRYSPTATFSR